MSDMIKETYKKEIEQINPSAEFLSSLTDTLEKEQAERKRRKITRLKIMITAAACITAVLCGTLSFMNSFNGGPATADADSVSSPPKSEIEHKFDKADTDTMTSKPVNPSTMFNEDMTAEQCAELFLDKAENGELSYIKVSDSNVFTSAQDNDEQKELLLDLMRTGKTTDSIPDGEKTYYMAVFTDGKIVKLIVTDGKYIEFSGINKYLCAE
ncbi:MAG: hypothetical protein Q4E74_06865 [Ruminococcus sp.]|nr:hypothetical protein [Ruminococcus sp.]